jgi:hypothetical protein
MSIPEKSIRKQDEKSGQRDKTGSPFALKHDKSDSMLPAHALLHTVPAVHRELLADR